MKDLNVSGSLPGVTADLSVGATPFVRVGPPAGADSPAPGAGPAAIGSVPQTRLGGRFEAGNLGLFSNLPVGRRVAELTVRVLSGDQAARQELVAMAGDRGHPIAQRLAQRGLTILEQNDVFALCNQALSGDQGSRQQLGAIAANPRHLFQPVAQALTNVVMSEETVALINQALGGDQRARTALAALASDPQNGTAQAGMQMVMGQEMIALTNDALSGSTEAKSALEAIAADPAHRGRAIAQTCLRLLSDA